jgi:hypothetical protein
MRFSSSLVYYVHPQHNIMTPLDLTPERFCALLERAWSCALPGEQVAVRNEMMRAIWSARAAPANVPGNVCCGYWRPNESLMARIKANEVSQKVPLKPRLSI